MDPRCEKLSIEVGAFEIACTKPGKNLDPKHRKYGKSLAVSKCARPFVLLFEDNVLRYVFVECKREQSRIDQESGMKLNDFWPTRFHLCIPTKINI